MHDIVTFLLTLEEPILEVKFKTQDQLLKVYFAKYLTS